MPNVDEGKADKGGQQLDDQTVVIFSDGLVNVPIDEKLRLEPCMDKQ